MQRRFQPKLHIKKGDKVMVVAGDDKGKTGTVLEVQRSKNRAIVENINLVRKHMKPTNDNPGGITEIAAPVHLSNLMLVDPKTGEPTRIGRKEVDGKLVRYSKTSGEIIR
ncbi:MAG: 50S ribosomal protein L24 [Saprospiraceae bacterium]|nr:50S ribosomal protein L24 [Saprospiraceae bacterium]